MTPMSEADAYAFLADGSRTGKVATVRGDGRPHVVPVWFVIDGHELVFMTGDRTVKARSLARDPRLALSVDLEEPPYAFVTVEGTATISDDLEAMLPYSIAIGCRYMGVGRGEEFGRRNAVAGEVLIRVTPTKIVGVGDVTA